MFILSDLLTRFRRDRSGNIAVTFALVCVPLISAVGCGVDYSVATRIRAKLQSAADAASVAAISQKSPGFTAAAVMTSDGTIAAGVTDANAVFDGNVFGTNSYTNLSRTSTVKKTGIKLTAKVEFSADVPVMFMKIVGKDKLTVTGSSASSASLPPYLDFYLTLDVSGSMGLPSTTAEAVRMQAINPDNYVQYPTGCTLACHFAPQKSACVDPPVTPPTNPARNPPTNSSFTQRYNTNGYCMGYAYSRVSQSALGSLLNKTSTSSVPKQVPGFPVTMVSGLPGSLNTDPTWGMPAVSSCPTDGTDACIQLRLDAVGYAVNQLFITANKKEVVDKQFRIGLYPFIRYLNANYFPLTSAINGNPKTPGTINYAAANLASLLDTNMDASLGSGGTHIDIALNSLNSAISSVGDGSSSTKTQPYIFLVTDGAQDPQVKGVPNGSWSGSNHATVLGDSSNNYPSICTTLKNRGIIVSILYIPYQLINPVNTSFANDEDEYANWNIPKIPPSLQACASPPDLGGSYFYTASSPAEIQNALNAMFNHSLQTAHITN
jgi:Flp pilus assembly protein TadG